MASIATLDFHVTSECSQECPYCWGPQNFENAVTTETSMAIIRKVVANGVRRIVFTGGDPLKRADSGLLICLAKSLGLEVALSTTGDLLTREFLLEAGPSIDLISVPLDGPCEAVSGLTKKAGHFEAVMQALDLLAGFPKIDVKIGTPVTRHNLASVPDIVRLLDTRAKQMPNRLFYNVFQAYPRAMGTVNWDELVVSDAEFDDLRQKVEAMPHDVHINWLSHDVLDRLYVMIFPDGSLTVPSGQEYLNYGPFLAIDDLEAVLSRTDFDAPKHLRHARGWEKAPGL